MYALAAALYEQVYYLESMYNLEKVNLSQQAIADALINEKNDENVFSPVDFSDYEIAVHDVINGNLLSFEFTV